MPVESEPENEGTAAVNDGDEEERTEDDDDAEIPLTYSITSYGADYPVDGLVKRINQGNIKVPDFQRGFVWNIKQASRFVESLLLGLPVPGIFLAREHQSQKLLVIDGQQRLRTLQYYYSGYIATNARAQSRKVFALVGVQTQFSGKTFEDLDPELQSKLHDSIIHATVIKQDHPVEDNSSIYHIFERLNTGGTSLAPQEIRACINYGPFNGMLHRLSGTAAWKNLYAGSKKNLRDEELILRFFALYYNFEKYEQPMKAFLNDFMRRHRNDDEKELESMAKIFERTLVTLSDQIGTGAFRLTRGFNAAVFDAVMIGIGKRLAQKRELKTTGAIKKTYDRLLKNAQFIEAVSAATAQVERVVGRINQSIEAFEGIA